MLKNILNLEGVKSLSKSQQKTIVGGILDSGPVCTKKACTAGTDCGSGICAAYNAPCDAWGDCGCGHYCL